MSSIKRIQRELTLYQNAPIDGIKIEPDSNDIRIWKASVKGPEGSPFEGGVFCITIKFPVEYPFKPPDLTLTTKMWHPQWNIDGYISVCALGIDPSDWTPHF